MNSKDKLMTYQPKQILVTGGAGFIGSNFVTLLLKKYPQIHIINMDKLTYAGSMDNLSHITETAELHNRHHFVKQDICNQSAVEVLLKKYTIDTIVHFAAESHVDRSIKDPALFIKTNIYGTYSLLEASKKIWLDEKKLSETQCRFHHISTDEVFGTLRKDDPAFTETTPYAPNSPYSASKASADHLVRAYHETYGLPVTLSNCSNNYGPRQHQEKLIPTVIGCCLEGKEIPIYGNGTNIRDWLYVNDHCEAIDKIIRHGKLGESYNIGGNEEHNNLEIVNIICETLGEIEDRDPDHFKKLIAFVKDRPGHDWRYAINASKIERELAWQPNENLKSGIRNTVKWYLDHASD